MLAVIDVIYFRLPAKPHNDSEDPLLPPDEEAKPMKEMPKSSEKKPQAKEKRNEVIAFVVYK